LREKWAVRSIIAHMALAVIAILLMGLFVFLVRARGTAAALPAAPRYSMAWRSPAPLESPSSFSSTAGSIGFG
jgi:hypothetical protein